MQTRSARFCPYTTNKVTIKSYKPWKGRGGWWVISPSHAFIITSYLNGEGRVKGQRWGWGVGWGWGGSSGKCLRILEKKEGKKNSIFFLIKINFLFFFFSCDSSTAWVRLHCPHFKLQMLGLCKKSSCFWSNQSRRRLLSLWCHQQLPTCQLAHKAGMWPERHRKQKRWYIKLAFT